MIFLPLLIVILLSLLAAFLVASYALYGVAVLVLEGRDWWQRRRVLPPSEGTR